MTFLSTRQKPIRATPLLALAAGSLPACDGVQSTLSPDGPAAAAIAELWWVMLVLGTAVSVIVIALIVYAVRRRRAFLGIEPPLRLTPSAEAEKRERISRHRAHRAGDPLTASDDAPLGVLLDTAGQDRRNVRWVLLGGVAIPAVILIGLFVFTLQTMGALAAQEEPELTIEIVGWQWWWEIRYLDANGERLFETANELHLPAGRRVDLRLESADVIHSVWIPQLAGKMDMVPGRTTLLRLEADRPGVYRGQCAEYCAGSHALMGMLAIVESQADFDRWVTEQTRPAAPPTDSIAAVGREVFLGNACRACHSVQGTPATGNIGPDLTHVASRRTLAAATLPNTRGHMGGWLANPQQLKPAANMPAVPMSNEEFLALLRYMETLR